MKIKVAHYAGRPNVQFLPIINEPHNVQYSHAKHNCLYWRVLRFPYKELVKEVAASENGTVKFHRSYIRAAIKTTETVLTFVFRYQVEIVERKKSDELNRRSVVEKERIFLIEANREEIIRMVDPVLVEMQNVNTARSAALFIQSYNDWAHPLTLEAMAAKLTEEQKRQAAKILRDMFVA